MIYFAYLTLLFIKGFASVMGTLTSKMDLLGLPDYGDVLKFGSVVFHIMSSLLLYFEILVLSSILYVLCYGLVVTFGGVKNEAGS